MKPSKHQAKYRNQGIFKTLGSTERGETNEVSPMIAPAEFLGRLPGCGAGMETEAPGGPQVQEEEPRSWDTKAARTLRAVDPEG